MKQALIQRVLALRGRLPELFARGLYRPLAIAGPLAEQVVAFLRSHADGHCLIVAPRLPGKLLGHGDSIVIPPTAWRDTVLRVPPDLRDRTLHDRSAMDLSSLRDEAMPLGRILAPFPVALLTTD